jgi:hypothetical protein
MKEIIDYLNALDEDDLKVAVAALIDNAEEFELKRN